MDWETFYSSFRSPDFIPGYEIEHRLGGGAFGEVYKARKHSIGKSYAIKFLKVDDGAQKDAVERELEQVGHFAAIDHPNLVTIEDMGTVLGVPYLVMGYAGEQTLGKRLERGDLSRKEALSFFIQTCRGVLALHDRRLVHFDLKPSNVFIHGDVARVGDYGLSKLMTEGRLTLSFGRGTPHYMAPEMVRGRADHRADIYSLGVILYESISGRVPFEVRSGAGIVVRESDAPPDFSEDFPADLRRVAERCLRLEPEKRYDDVEELLEDLGQTARRGDSVRLEHVQPAPEPASVAQGAFAPRAAAVAEQTPPPAREGSSGELRATAPELTRGAVEVARGVWDGLRTAKTPGSGRPAGQQAPLDPQPREAAPAATPDAAETSPPPSAAGGQPIYVPPPRPVTIPVPPRARGGALGTLVSTVGLAAEVFLSLLRGILSSLGGFLVRTHRRLAARSSSRMGKALRLGVFYGGVALLALLVLSLAVEALR